MALDIMVSQDKNCNLHDDDDETQNQRAGQEEN